MASVILTNPAARRSFDRVVYFFNRLGPCIEAEVCSKPTARIFLDETLLQFTANFGDHIRERRRDLPS